MSKSRAREGEPFGYGLVEATQVLTFFRLFRVGHLKYFPGWEPSWSSPLAGWVGMGVFLSSPQAGGLGSGGRPQGSTADPTCRGPNIPRSSAAQWAKRQPQLASESNPKAAHAGTVTSEADRKIACTDAGHRISLGRTITTPLQCASCDTNVIFCAFFAPFLYISATPT